MFEMNASDPRRSLAGGTAMDRSEITNTIAKKSMLNGTA